MSECKPPSRAVVMIAKIEADSRAELSNALYNLSIDVERGTWTQSTSGGHSSSHIVSVTEHPEQTHDAYFQQLNEYLKGLRRPTTQGEQS